VKETQWALLQCLAAIDRLQAAQQDQVLQLFVQALPLINWGSDHKQRASDMAKITEVASSKSTFLNFCLEFLLFQIDEG